MIYTLKVPYVTRLCFDIEAESEEEAIKKWESDPDHQEVDEEWYGLAECNCIGIDVYSDQNDGSLKVENKA